jgi:hypothetical protein
MVAELAGRIAHFHRTSERNERIDAFGGIDIVRGNWAENFQQTEPYIGRTITHNQLEEVRAFAENALNEDDDLFARRVEEGRIRDCHGDMRADAICFTGGEVCIFDCIEFNERFRYSDVASDIAFLAMDLEFRGRQDLSDELMSRYLGETLDSTLPLLLPFYKCYRAYVRGKVDGFQLDQPEISEEQKRQVTAGARRYFELAHAYATTSASRTLVITVGVTGSGKSFFANALASRIGAFVTSSDVTRKLLAGVPPTERHAEPADAGIYDPAMTERTYSALLDEARPWLERGKAVVLDATYLSREHRLSALRLAREAGARFLAVECEADEALVWQRLSQRSGEERAVSDGRWEIYQAQQEQREPVDELPFGSHAALDAGRPLREQVDAVLRHLAQHET